MVPLKTLALATAATLVLAAQDFWTVKDSPAWTQEDIRKLVTDSPWAAQAEVTGADAGNPAPRILTRWESARPVREACARGGMESYLASCVSRLWNMAGLAEKFTGYAGDFYVVSMSGYPKPPSTGKEPPEHSAAAKAALEQLGQSVQPRSLLRRAGKPPVRAAQVLVLPSGGGLLVTVFFPRTDLITVEDEEVWFESAAGTLAVKSRFSLRKMVYQGSLQL